MSNRIELTSARDHRTIGALHVPHVGARRGGVVVVQEIFGVTDHIAAMAHHFAGLGYDVLAPSMYDRVEPGFRVAVDAEGMTRARAAMIATPWDQVQGDVQAAVDHLRAAGGPVYVTGFCWGGAAAWLAACRVSGVTAASCFYGRAIHDMRTEVPKVPVLLHYGERDASIPATAIADVRALHPDVPVHLYPAGHGFCRAGSPDHDAASCALALERTAAWFAANPG